jgi:amino acid permease
MLKKFLKKSESKTEKKDSKPLIKLLLIFSPILLVFVIVLFLFILLISPFLLIGFIFYEFFTYLDGKNRRKTNLTFDLKKK